MTLKWHKFMYHLHFSSNIHRLFIFQIQNFWASSSAHLLSQWWLWNTKHFANFVSQWNAIWFQSERADFQVKMRKLLRCMKIQYFRKWKVATGSDLFWAAEKFGFWQCFSCIYCSLDRIKLYRWPVCMLNPGSSKNHLVLMHLTFKNTYKCLKSQKLRSL